MPEMPDTRYAQLPGLEQPPPASERIASAGGAIKRKATFRSFVTRDPEWLIWFRRVVLKRKPVLFQIEVPIVDHCTLDCAACPSFANLCEPSLADIDQFESDLRLLSAAFSNVRRVQIVGGEPMLHPKVLEFLARARAIFPRSRIYLRTNGTLLMQQDEPFWDALRASKVTLLVGSRPVGLPAVEIDLAGKQRGVKVEWTRPDREQVRVPIDPLGSQDASDSFSRCRGVNNRPILRDGRLYPCAFVAYSEVFRSTFGIRGLQIYPTDWISIRDEHDPEEIFEFLRGPVHWCSNCDQKEREVEEWRASKHVLTEWLTKPPTRR
ncbi:MAG: radical SAM protein [Coriobacteriia bacterium]|nr:radical SAM protein [Coriobacteriia bacterium]